MSFNPKFFIAADSEIQKRHTANVMINEQRKREIITRFPQYRELSRALAETGEKLVGLFMTGGDTAEGLKALEQENLAIQSKIEELLVKNGYPPNYLAPIYSCENCHDTGLSGDSRCSCFMDIVKRMAGAELNSKSPIKLSSFETFDVRLYPDEYDRNYGVNIRETMRQNYEYCKSYAENFHIPTNSILMCGKTGLGKTHLSLAIANEVLRNGSSVVYGSAPDLFRKIEQEHFGGKPDETIELLQSADLLILDDLGAEFGSAFYNATLYSLINTRSNSRLPMIINTNFSLSELNSRYDERITSRLMIMEMVTFLGRDIRQIRK